MIYLLRMINKLMGVGLSLVQHWRGMVALIHGICIMIVIYSLNYQMSKCHSVHESSPESRFYTYPCTPKRAVRASSYRYCVLACLTSLYCVPIAVTTISLFCFPFPFQASPPACNIICLSADSDCNDLMLISQ